MSELRANSQQPAPETPEANGLVFESVDGQMLSEARERNAARLRLVWNARGWIFRVAALGLALSTAVAFLIPKRYTSTVRLMPPDQTSTGTAAMLAALGGSAGRVAGMAQSALGLKTTGDLFIGILESDTVRDELIQKFNLQGPYSTRYLEDTRKVLAAQTDISEDRKSGIISVRVTDHSPERATLIAQEYVNELNWVVSHQTTSSAHRERVFLEERLAQVKRELEASENDFSQFASRNTAIDVPQQGKAMVTASATLQGQLIGAESELEGLRQIYTNNNVRVRATEARVGKLRSALEQIAGAGASEKSTIGDLYPSLRELPLLGVTYADLLRRTKVDEAVFETLTQEYELAKVEEAREVPTVKVLDPPRVPEKKSFPPRLQIMALGTLLAVLFGVTWVLGQRAWESVDPNDPRKALMIAVWGDVRASLPGASSNGSGLGRPVGWLRRKFRRSQVKKAEACSPFGGPENIEAGESKQQEPQP